MSVRRHIHFWGASGHLLLDRDADGRLVVTDDYLKAYLARPELLPPPEACAAERALHARLMDDPRRPVTTAEIAAIADPDARENWNFFRDFRGMLLSAPHLEAAYVGLIRSGAKGIPPLFLDQLVHVILRNALEGHENPFEVRAAEIFFRPQRVSFHEGTILLADEEIIAGHETDRHASPLMAMLGQPAVAGLDVLTPSNADEYWGRSDGHEMVLDLGGTPSGRQAIAAVIARWIRHLHGIEAAVEPVERIADKDWRWFVGLDAEATRIGNALWRGDEIEPDAPGRIVALFRIDLPNDAPVTARVAGHPIYAMLAMTEDKRIRMKPQNLVTGLPLREAAEAN